ncbi:energy transducer TonB [Alteromonas sp. ASW11-19]|uniref:Energy transducer TonB n=1 Tax=Alteromonas salexigens TaxID=2982530 RepID=A0ABT2VN46_9ALTE|nr:energy transducer TonB [Alteromonas salexigens]MCU7554740.1 energy transducer TonB [Alteromonas salexigens]
MHVPSLSAALTALSLLVPVHGQTLDLPCDDKKDQALQTASEEEVARITSFTPAEAVDRENPRYPRQAAQHGQEGWVQMSYVIDEEGNVLDAVVEDYVGNTLFKRSALRALKQWKFTPAMQDGKPTQQCHQKVQFDFYIDGARGASRQFVAAYKDIEALIRTDNLAEAEKGLQTLHERTDSNRYENAWLYSLDAMLAKKLNDGRRELKSLRRAVASARSHDEKHATFDSNYTAFMYQRQFVLHTRFLQLADALAAAEKLAAMEGQADHLAAIQPAIDKIHAYIASADNIFVPLALDESGVEFHALSRNQFAFADILGQLDTVEVRCETQREIFTVAEAHIWTIPESWGACRVLVAGQAGAAFNLVEVAGS